jgi:membrane protein
MKATDLIGLVRETTSGWYGGPTFQLGAALAFYGAFALAPMLMIAIAVAGILFGEEAAQGQLADSLEAAVGPAVAEAIAITLEETHVTGSCWVATLLGVGFVLFASTGMVIQLQAALNAIWGVQPRPGLGLWTMVRSRFVAFVLVLGIGGLLLLLLIAETVLATLHGLFPEGSWSRNSYVWEKTTWLLLLVLLILLFAMIYKLLPDVIITWRDVWVGALVSALPFAIGNYLVGFYLGRIAALFPFGAAGCLVMVMLWVYYSSQVLLFGAEFTKNFTHKYGEPVRPADHAMYLPGRACTARENVATRAGPSQSPANSPS